MKTINVSESTWNWLTMLKLAKGYKSIEATILSFKPKTAAPRARAPEPSKVAFDIIPNATEDEIRASLQAEAERKEEE